MFIFVTLPEDISAGSLLVRALERNVAFVPGEEFHLDGTGQNTMRLNFTKASVAEINSGISRLEILTFMRAICERCSLGPKCGARFGRCSAPRC
jgi:DNA-binding transcriptional MocR family regulator